MNLNKYFNYYIALLRAFPCIIPTSSIFFSILFQQKIGLIFGIFFMIVDKFAGLSKIISEKIYSLLKTDSIYLLGKGKRPVNAKFCGCFISEDNLCGKTTSFGMTSGHSLLAMFTAIFWSLYIINHYKNDTKRTMSLVILNMSCIAVCISRIYLNCHTIQQVIIGGLLGCLFGKIGYNLYKKINNL